MTFRKFTALWMAAGLSVGVVLVAGQQPVTAQGRAFPLFFDGAPDAEDLKDGDADIAAFPGTRTTSVVAGLFLENERLATVVAGKGSVRGQRAGRISVRNVFGNRASGTANVALDTEGGVAEGTYSLRGFSRGEFTAELIEPDEDSNEKFQGTWVSDGKLTKDDFVLTLRGNALTLRGRSDQFGTFEFQGQWSAMFNPDFGKASREIKIKGKEIEFETQIGLVPTRVRTPRGVFPFDAVNLPDPLFAFLDPKTNALVVFLGQSDGDLVVTPLIQE